MATVDDALDAAATAAAAASAAAGRLDSVKQNQLAMTQQLNTITQQLQLLIQGGGGAGSRGGGLASGGAGGSGGGLAGGALAAAVGARLAVALAAAAEAQVAVALSVARMLAEERRNDVESIHHAWTRYLATHRSLNCARGGIIGTISAN